MSVTGSNGRAGHCSERGCIGEPALSDRDAGQHAVGAGPCHAERRGHHVLQRHSRR